MLSECLSPLSFVCFRPQCPSKKKMLLRYLYPLLMPPLALKILEFLHAYTHGNLEVRQNSAQVADVLGDHRGR